MEVNFSSSLLVSAETKNDLVDPQNFVTIVPLVLGDFDSEIAAKWMVHHWTLSFYIVAPYFLFVWYGPIYMRNRKALDLKWALILWNIALAMFSIRACVTLLPEFYKFLNQPNGFHDSVCAPASILSRECHWWGWLFTLAKVIELFDTVFLVLRKRNVIFLHWFHHVTVLIYNWYGYSAQLASGRWFIAVNYTIHALMYTYYGLCAVGVRIPKRLAMALTSMQLSQMIIGVTVNMYAYQMVLKNIDCDMPLEHIYLGFFIYGSYFVLFAQFFYKSYINRNFVGKVQREKAE